MPCSRHLPTSVNSIPVVAVGGAEGLQGMLAAGIYRVVVIHELNQRLSVSSRKRRTVPHPCHLGAPSGRAEKAARASGSQGLEYPAARRQGRGRAQEGRGRQAVLAGLREDGSWLGKLVEQGDSFGDLMRSRGWTRTPWRRPPARSRACVRSSRSLRASSKRGCRPGAGQKRSAGPSIRA
jgi:hypothetical protein